MKCFTCPRERRAGEPGWYFVDLQHRLRAPAPARIFVCPRHYGRFAEGEKGRWEALVETVVAFSPSLAAYDPNGETAASDE